MNRWFIFSLLFMISAFCISLNNKERKVENAGLLQHYTAADSTLNGEWFLQPVLPSDTATGKIPILHFNISKGTFTGNNGCNSMRGSFSLKGNSLVFNKNIITTKMLCTGYNERAFMESLLRTNQYKIENGQLVLMAEGTQLSRWAREVKKRPVTGSL